MQGALFLAGKRPLAQVLKQDRATIQSIAKEFMSAYLFGNIGGDTSIQDVIARAMSLGPDPSNELAMWVDTVEEQHVTWYGTTPSSITLPQSYNLKHEIPQVLQYKYSDSDAVKVISEQDCTKWFQLQLSSTSLPLKTLRLLVCYLACVCLRILGRDYNA
jgi:hypothetical protein